jgi:hypothetical protein
MIPKTGSRFSNKIMLHKVVSELNPGIARLQRPVNRTLEEVEVQGRHMVWPKRGNENA